ncbi:MAG: D-sedoheptulose 7-phosphate isomerase [Chitinophagaceae bacterium]|nr:D-sedoheptulose 7-phosphate isomerase [Chitinophagaceae bacterium]
MISQIRSLFESSVSTKQAVLQDEELLGRIEQAARTIADAFKDGHRVYFCGNGGSAADAQHLAAEFSGPFYNRGRRALPADALHCNTSYLTAAANDYDYTEVYARLVEGIMQPGDVLVGLSTSGNSPNVVKAFEKALEKNITTIGMTGTSGGKMAAFSQILLNVPSLTTPRIQEVHMLIGHIICELVEAELFPKS